MRTLAMVLASAALATGASSHLLDAPIGLSRDCRWYRSPKLKMSLNWDTPPVPNEATSRCRARRAQIKNRRARAKQMVKDGYFNNTKVAYKYMRGVEF